MGRPKGSKNKKTLEREGLNTSAESEFNAQLKRSGISVNEKDISTFVKNCYSLKPNNLKMDSLTWKFLIRNILRGDNILIVGKSGSAKTMAAHCAAAALQRPVFNIPLGSTQDPRSSIVGNTHYNKESGTFFSESIFVKAIQTPNAVVILDELSRGHTEAWNLLMPVLDYTQRFLRIEETENSKTVNVAKGVSFIMTANIGNEYTATRVLDRALIDRCSIVEMKTLNFADESDLLKIMFPDVKPYILEAIADISTTTRSEEEGENGKLSTSMSTRAAVMTAALIRDGFTLAEAAEVNIYPFFAADGGADSERTFVKQVVQKHCGERPDDDMGKIPIDNKTLMTPVDYNNAKS